MAQFGAAMPQYMGASRPLDMLQQANGQDPRRPSGQPIMHVVGDVRPRLTKEQHDMLEAQFQQQNKPSTNTKKGFADQLGVPLDKINNWFQNRRAKVKQDAKKQANAMNMYQQQIAAAQMNNQPPPQPHEFFAANPHLDSSAFSTPLPHQADGNMQSYTSQLLQQQQQQQQHQQPQFVTAHHSSPVVNDGVMHAMHAPEYSFNGVDMPALEQRQLPMAFGPSDDFSMFDQQFTMTHVQDFAPPAFADMPVQAEGYDIVNYAAAPMRATQSNGSTPSTIGSVQSGSLANSVGNMSVPTVSTEWSDDCKPSIHFSASMDDFSQTAYCSPPEEPTRTWLQHQPSFEQTLSPEDINRPNSTHELPPTPPNQAESKPMFALPSDLESDISDEGLSRRPSFGLVESFGDVDIQSRCNSADESDFKQPSGLAARRQRPRPAALGSAALRSASYCAGMPNSPGASNNLNPPEQTLRRIRSSGPPGVVNGRIQKSATASGQRSPLSMSFPDAAVSPKFARQASFAHVASPGQTTLAPPTPLTPNDAARFPAWQSHGGQALSVDNGSPNGVAVSWAGGSPAVFPVPMTSSPPETPLDADQAVPYQAYMPDMQQQIYRDTPPQSAPATQQAFGITLGVPGMPEAMSMNPGHMAHYRRISEGHNTAQPAVPVFRGTVTDLSMAYQVPYEQLQVAQPQVTVPTQTTAAFPTPPQPAPISIPVQNGSMLAANFAVHEYTPPAGDVSAKESPLSVSKQSFGELPKTYHFANSGPKDYKGQEIA